MEKENTRGAVGVSKINVHVLCLKEVRCSILFRRAMTRRSFLPNRSYKAPVIDVGVIHGTRAISLAKYLLPMRIPNICCLYRVADISIKVPHRNMLHSISDSMGNANTAYSKGLQQQVMHVNYATIDMELHTPRVHCSKE